MFRKVHYRLTLLCAGITTLILLIMSFVSLSVSEAGLKKNSLLSFQKDIDTLTADFGRQAVFTREKLFLLEKETSFLIYILDNDRPFLYSTQNHTERQLLTFEEALLYYDSVFSVEIVDPDREPEPWHQEYEFTSSAGEKYQASLATFPGESGEVRLLILSPLAKLMEQIKEQRLLFLSIDAAAAVFLFLFSFLFTGRLLRPVEKSRKEQILFIASASHELRTPLAVILSCADACKKASPEEEKGFLSTIRSEGRRMSRLIDDMLFLSKADTHSFDTRQEKIEPDTLLLDSYEAFTAMAKQKDIRLCVDLPDQVLPSCCGDRERLRQVLAILMHNAVSYTPPGGTVVLSLSLRGGHPAGCCFHVADNGPGIPDEEKENIFRRFYRVEKSRSTKEHFGLGLCIASEIMTAMKGSIQVTDTPGGGSTFLVTVPLFIPGR